MRYRVCTKCRIHHYENCGSCWGFGVYKVHVNINTAFPVTAEEAHDNKLKGKVFPCPECGSTENGLPMTKYKVDISRCSKKSKQAGSKVLQGAIFENNENVLVLTTLYPFETLVIECENKPIDLPEFDIFWIELP